jgi:hypothetical protein
MGKLVTSVGILSMVLLGFHFLGYIENTPSAFLLNLLLDPSNANGTEFFSGLSGILTLFGGFASIIIGAFAANKIEQAVTITFTNLLLFVVGWDIIAIFNVLRNINSTLSIFLISPLFIIYLIVVIEWWRGKD